MITMKVITYAKCLLKLSLWYGDKKILFRIFVSTRLKVLVINRLLVRVRIWYRLCTLDMSLSMNLDQLAKKDPELGSLPYCL